MNHDRTAAGRIIFERGDRISSFERTPAGRLIRRGGAGSGNFGHSGRPGEVGGSQSQGGGSDLANNKKFNSPTQPVGNGVVGTAFTTQNWVNLAENKMAALSPEEMEKINTVEKNLKDGTPTIEIFFNEETGEWDEDRLLLHEEIIDSMMNGIEPSENPELILSGGLPGSGKSTVLEAAGINADEFVMLDSDYIKSKLPEYEGWNAGLVHMESTVILSEVIRRSIENDLSVVYDSTIKTFDRTQEFVDAFKAQGYDANLIFVDIPMETAIDRALTRFERSGRYVSPFYIATHNHKNAASFEKLKTQVDSWQHWDNSTFGTPPTLIEESNG